jgi:exonuclease SbcC
LRIEKIRLKNLNSLLGTWEIDLTVPEYQSDGLFAITGPTGSGKTTILDAICLALYGRTPRLDKVNKGENEIMSRQAGDCDAQVVFRTAAGTHLCQWSQRRARGRPGANLQGPEHKLSEHPSGRVLAEAVSTVPAEVERLTGLAFNRFTRSTLLAQGRFAAFLEATAENRSDILEQLTGTDLYSRISMKAHERAAAARRRLEAETAALKGLEPIGPDEEAALRERLAALEAERAALEERSASERGALAWRGQLAALEAELVRLDARRGNLDRRRAEFAPHQDRLDLAAKAQELAVEHAALVSVRAEAARLASAAAEAAVRIPALEVAAAEAAEDSERAEAACAAAKRAVDDTADELKLARALDLRLEGARSAARKAEAEADESARSIESLGRSLSARQGELASLSAEAAETSARLSATADDEALGDRLAAWSERAKALEEAERDLGARAEEIARHRQAAGKAEAEARRLEAAAIEADAAAAAAEAAAAADQAALDDLLAGRHPGDLREDFEALGAGERDLGRAAALAGDQAGDLGRLGRMAGLRERLLAAGRGLEAKMAEAGRARDEARAARDRIEEAGRLKAAMAGLQGHRQALVEGEPCPLCGSTSHPWTLNLPEEPRVGQTDLKRARQNADAAEAAIAAIGIELARNGKDLERHDAEAAETAARLPVRAAELGDLWGRLGLEGGPAAGWGGARAPSAAGPGEPSWPDGGLWDRPWENPEIKETLERQAADLAALAKVRGAEAKALKTVIGRAEAIDKALGKARAALAALAGKAAKARADLGVLLADLEAKSRVIGRLAEEEARARSAMEERAAELAGELAAFGETGAPRRSLANLARRRDGREAAKLRLGELEMGAAGARSDVANLSERLAEARTALAALEADLEGRRREIDGWSRDRQALLGGRDPQAVEDMLKNNRTKTEAALDTARALERARGQELLRAGDALAALERDLAARRATLAEAEPAMAGRLAGAGFGSEEAYLAALLPEAERKRLAQAAQSLMVEAGQLAALQAERSRELAEARARELTTRSAEELERSLEALAAESGAALMESGQIGARLEANERLKSERRSALEAIGRTRAEHGRLEALSGLIGSADGKRYRNFAQGLTFDNLVRQANRQLRLMSNRYILLHDRSRPLEPSVVDGYQAAEIRPVKNLSGGESFIVSLALALGLSSMAGQKVRVDSLFLDEGFGTLDEDSLDMALAALGGLRREGKLIGLISHVPAISERIATIIKVRPLSGGRSALEGPGCREL